MTHTWPELSPSTDPREGLESKYCKHLGKENTGNEREKRGTGMGERERETGNEERGTRKGSGERKWENEKFETKPKQTTGNKANESARVLFRSCSHFSITCFLCSFTSSRFWFSYHLLEKVRATEALRNDNSANLTWNESHRLSTSKTVHFFP